MKNTLIRTFILFEIYCLSLFFIFSSFYGATMLISLIFDIPAGLSFFLLCLTLLINSMLLIIIHARVKIKYIY
jgi:hypothetical protein